MKLNNQTMEMYLMALRNISDKVTGRFAYAVARNMRKLSDNLVEYMAIRDRFIREYGEKTENGDSRIMRGSEAFDKFSESMAEYVNIEHEIQLMTINQEDVLNSSLNANEIMTIDFMMEDTE